MPRSFGILALLAALAAPAIAQTAAKAPPNCSAAEYRQLDFWAGDWTVFDTAKGYQVGTSRIEKIMNGCGIRESYDSPEAPGGAYAGTSYSGYDRNDRQWHQFYVDVNGNMTWFSGGLAGADMVLVAPGRGGSQQRMTYRPHDDGSVQQIGVVSTDGGKIWQPGYDYTYRRK